MIEQAQFQQALIMFAETCIFTLGRGNLQTIDSHGCEPIASVLRGVIKTTLSAAFVRRGRDVHRIRMPTFVESVLPDHSLLAPHSGSKPQRQTKLGQALEVSQRPRRHVSEDHQEVTRC